MDNKGLFEILNSISDKIEGRPGNWKFSIDDTIFICLTDEFHNRMRFISPIRKISDVEDHEIRRCMEANFHTALDAKYAISDDLMWAVFIHPLKELTKEQTISAISQVYSCAKTYGTTYSGGSLSFPTQDERDARKN